MHSLPPLVAIGVVTLALLMGILLLLLPLAAVLKSEVTEVRRHYGMSRDLLKEQMASGANRRDILLIRLLLWLEMSNRVVGHCLAGLALIMVLVQFAVVILRYVFAFGSLPMQESVGYMYAMLFMLGAGYTLLVNGHVRVDVFYSQADSRYRCMVDLLGSLFFVLPLCGTLAWFGWTYVANAWAVREGSAEVGGLPYLYLLKSLILVFALLVALQAIATIVRSGLRLRGHPLHS